MNDLNRPSIKTWRRLSLAFFALLLVVGVSIYDDYGVSWDGPAQRTTGGSNVRYICEQTSICEVDEYLRQFPPLPKMINRDYSPIHEIILTTAEWQLGLNDSKQIYELRNLLNFLLFFLGTIAFFAFVSDTMGHPKYGLIAACMLVLTPRIFGHIFFNTKDLAFLASILIALFTMGRFLKKPNLQTAIIHGLATGFSIDTRIMGVVVLVCTILASTIQIVKSRKKIASFIASNVTYIVASCIATIAMWPHLWHRPAANFAQSFENMAHFRWSGSVKYLGEMVKADALPWHYAPTWIGITIPPVYLILIAIGIVFVFRKLVSNRFGLWKNHQEMMALICTGIFFAPIVAVVVLQSTLYDGWRQLFFVYPAGVFLGVFALHSLSRVSQHSKVHISLIAGTALFLAMIISSYQIYASHPFQNGNFNMFAGANPSTKFDNDYWGISNRQVLEKISQADDSDSISIAGKHSGPVENALLPLPTLTRKRFRVMKAEDLPDYILTNHRLDPKGAVAWRKGYEHYDDIDIFGDKITSVYRKVRDKD